MSLHKKGQQELGTEQRKKKLDGWRDKPLHGQYPSISNEKSASRWRWLQKEYLNKKKKSLLMATQDQTLVTRAYKVIILTGLHEVQMCDKRDETVMHISGNGQSRSATVVHRELCSKYGFEPVKLWYKHRALLF